MRNIYNNPRVNFNPDGTVTFWNVIYQVWETKHTCMIPSVIVATLPSPDRERVIAMSDALSNRDWWDLLARESATS